MEEKNKQKCDKTFGWVFKWSVALKNFELYLIIILLAVLSLISSIPVDRENQILISVVLISCLYILTRFFSRKGLPRILYLGSCVFIVLRYIYWRFFFTLSYDDFFSFICSCILFAGELYGVYMFLISSFVNLRPVEREPAAIIERAEDYPSVDVFIPSYDEDEDLLIITLIGALSMRYPKDKLKVYLLDDGGTVAKRTQPDIQKAQQAKERHITLQVLCKKLGAIYLTRVENDHAKAGNMNAAFPHSNGELILILDADHVPAIDFLEKTAQYFNEDKKLFLVQTPHFFINPDPIERNLGLFQNMPSENLMFYGAILPGLDFWNAAFFCGSAAILRREALLETGGFSGESITEDAETALGLHAKGWNSRYLKHPVISGLQPETFASFMIQRMRWAQGMMQIFLLKNPLKMKGLSVPQKISYLSSMTFWFFPITRMVFVFAPIAFLVFGLHIYDASLAELMIYTLPYLIVLVASSGYLFGNVRWNFISNVYELMQSMYSFGAVVEVFKNPRSPKFGVTPKAETMEKDFISPLAKPFYWMIIGTAIVLGIGLSRFIIVVEERGLISIALFWTIFNFILYSASLGALLERKQRRASPRLPAGFYTDFCFGDDKISKSIYVSDISVGGANLVSLESLGDDLKQRTDLFVVGENHLIQESYKIPIKVRDHWRMDGKYIYGISFERETIEQYRDIILLVHGDSQRWKTWMENCAPDPGLLKGMSFLAKLGCVHIVRYFLIYTAAGILRYFPIINKIPLVNKMIKNVSL